MNVFKIINEKEFISSGSLLQRSDGIFIIAWGKKTFLSDVTSYPEVPIWYKNDFFLESEKPFYIHDNWTVLDKLPLIEQTERLVFGETSTFKVDLPELFKSVRKIVLYRNVRAEKKSSIVHFLRNTDPNKSGIYFGNWDQNGGFFGFTPERLFEKREGTSLAVFAVAGTKKRDELFSSKEEREHEWVIRGIEVALASFGNVKRGMTEIGSFGSLDHLMTTFSFVMEKKLSYRELIARLHPTAALGGYPKNESIVILRDFAKKYPRGPYGAPFGYFYKDEARVVIAIRALFWDEKSTTIFGGAGITEESDLAKELEEMALKIEVTKEIILYGKFPAQKREQ